MARKKQSITELASKRLERTGRFAEAEAAPPTEATTGSGQGSGSLTEVPIGAVAANVRNVRAEVADLDQLAASIEQMGILQPLVVRPATPPEVEAGEGVRYTIVMGHRRHAAALQVGLTTVPVVVRSDEAMAEREQQAMLIENLMRQDLTAVEEAHAYSGLAETGLSQRQIAEQVGVTQAHVSRRLALLRTTPEVQAAVVDGLLRLEVVPSVGRLSEEVQQTLMAKLREWYGNDHAWEADAVRREVDRAERAAWDAEAETAAKEAGARLLRAWEAPDAVPVTDEAQVAELAERGELLAVRAEDGPGLTLLHEPETDSAPAKAPATKASAESEERARWKRLREGVAAWVAANPKPPKRAELVDRVAAFVVATMSHDHGQAVHKWLRGTVGEDTDDYYRWAASLTETDYPTVAWFVTVAADLYGARHNVPEADSTQRTAARIEEVSR